MNVYAHLQIKKKMMTYIAPCDFSMNAPGATSLSLIDTMNARLMNAHEMKGEILSAKMSERATVTRCF